MVGHNWGAEHAERWIWLHASGFEGAAEDTWLDLGIGRIKVGPLTAPWIANGALSIDGERHAIGGPGRLRKTSIEESPTGCRVRAPGLRRALSGTVSAPKEAFVGWVYADPDGSEHHTVNCSVADLELEVTPGRKPAHAAGARGGRLRARHARARPRHGDPALPGRLSGEAPALVGVEGPVGAGEQPGRALLAIADGVPDADPRRWGVASRRRSARRDALRSSQPGSSAANSSPPSRASRSAARSSGRQAEAHAFRV